MPKPKIVEASGGFLSIVDANVHLLNNSKYFAGLMMLLMNLGSRYISLELSQVHEEILSNVFVRRALVFTIIFIATRDIKVSLIFTALFVVLVSGVFNENSQYCLLPGKYDPKKISKEEYHYAQTIIEKYHKQIKKDKET